MKRRALLVIALGLVSAAGVTFFDAEQSGRTFLLVRNLTNGPLTDVEVTGPQGGVAVGQLAVGEAKGNPITRAADNRYTFQISYKAGGRAMPESNLRILGGKEPFEAVELHIGLEGVTSMARTADDGAGGKAGRFLADLRRRLGL